MSVPEYLETLDRFGLTELKCGGDLQLKNGNIALTADGNFQFGSARFNALFRLVERWRLNQPTLNELFGSMLLTSQRLEEVIKARAQGIGPSINMNPVAFHEETESIGDYESGSSVFAGSILVVLSNLLQRFKKDLNPSKGQWESAGLMVNGFSIGVIFSAAAANFRHHDEWARMQTPNAQQQASMDVLCAILERPLMTNGFPTIRTNVCREVIIKVSGGSVDRLHQITFDYAKALSS